MLIIELLRGDLLVRIDAIIKKVLFVSIDLKTLVRKINTQNTIILLRREDPIFSNISIANTLSAMHAYLRCASKFLFRNTRIHLAHAKQDKLVYYICNISSVLCNKDDALQYTCVCLKFTNPAIHNEICKQPIDSFELFLYNETW
jgi:hypothetical protein